MCYYSNDVSDYVLGYVLGVEWDEMFVDYVCRFNEGIAPYQGAYISSRQEANAVEIFFSQWGDYLLKYEDETYGTQKLLSFANWPETDPLVNEVSPKLSVASATENTEAFIDLENLQLSDKVVSGMFASYNVYPYFPASLQYGKYTEYIDDEGNRNPYRKYLMELVDHLHEAHRGHLGGDHHDGHDEGEHQILALEIIDMDAIGRQGGEVGGEDGCGDRDEQAVQHTPGDVDGGVGPGVFQVVPEMLLGQEAEARLQLGVAAGGVDDHDIEGKQTQDRQKDQYGVDHDPQQGQHQLAFGILAHLMPPLRARWDTGSLYWADRNL